MLIDTTDPLWPRISAAFCSVQGPVPDGVKPDDFAIAAIFGHIKSVVRVYEADVALKPDPAIVEAAAVKVDTDFSEAIWSVPIAKSPLPDVPV
jgi:hypothetical protein